MKRQAAAVVVLGGLLAVAVWHAVVTSTSALTTSDTCAATAAAEHERAAAADASRLVADDRETFATCACTSLVALGRVATCATLLAELDVDVPPVASVALALLEHHHAQPAMARAAAYAAIRSTTTPPDELVDRAVQLSSTFDETFWAEQAQRSPELALAVARAANAADHARFGLQVLGPSPTGAELHDAWRVLKGRLLASLADEAAALQHLEDSVATGTPRPEAEADFALAQIEAMRATARGNDALARAWVGRKELPRDLASSVASALAQYYNVSQQYAALARLTAECVAEGFPARFNMAQVQSMLPENKHRLGEISVTADIDGVLLASPDDELPLDTEYQEIVINSGVPVQVKRSVADHPVRFVLRDIDGQIRGATQTWLVPDKTQDLVIKSGSPWPTPPAYLRNERPGDGTRRVVVLVVDSGDWRYLTWGFAAQQLPTLEGLKKAAITGVMTSDPPSTVAAMVKLTEPSPRAPDTPLLLQRLGKQLQAALSLPVDPWRESRLLSQAVQPSLIDVVTHEKRVLNMLFGHGTIRAGDTGLTGPQGVEHLELHTSRPLRDDEDVNKGLSPDEKSLETYREQLEGAAAQFDDLIRLVAAKQADLYLYRYDPTDMLAHNYLSSWSRKGDMPRESSFFDGYRYLDRRLNELTGVIDGDDLLLVVSDHGTQNSANHDTRSLLLLFGSGVSVGRVDGVKIDDLPSWLSGFLCVDEPWKYPVPNTIPGCK